MSDLVPVKRALISVSDKTGLAEFASALHTEFGVELVSTGGTARFLRERGLPVRDVSDLTGFPEMMDGRIKTLHPKVHGGLLAVRDNPEHAAAAEKHGIGYIDLVCINLYPFEQTIAKPGVSFEEAIENIDIGGPAMVRSAAKNHRFVLVVTAPADYDKVLGDLRKHSGSSCQKHRLKQAQKAFAHTAAYDARIKDYLQKKVDEKKSLPDLSHRFSFSAPPHGPIDAPAADLPEGAAVMTRSKLVQRLLDPGRSFLEFIHDLLMTQAILVGATEAAAFAVAHQGPQLGLMSVSHIRPDGAAPDVRAKAIQAFLGIVAPCVDQDRDGAFEVGSPDGESSQYCLVSILRDEGKIAAATAVIVRAGSLDEARRRLQTLQLMASYFELFSFRKRQAPASAAAPEAQALPANLDLRLRKQADLRYGENPHQKAALYVPEPPASPATREASVAFAKQHHGKELSYINLLDADAALAAVKELVSPAACIVKHATPCGFATATDLPTAFRNAFAGDPLAAFGGIVALNQPVDLATAQAITSIDKLLEVIVAPGYAPDALDLLKTRWKNVRLLEVPGRMQLAADPAELMMHRIVGGFLVQERDLLGLDEKAWKTVSNRPPTAREVADLMIAWLACKHVKSNAIVIARSGMMLGSGAGQQDRVNACRIAIQKAGDRVQGAVAASDAFFPFPDGPEFLLNAGVTAIIHPGGSVKDQETIDLVNQRNAALILTGQRHFKH